MPLAGLMLINRVYYLQTEVLTVLQDSIELIGRMKHDIANLVVFFKGLSIIVESNYQIARLQVRRAPTGRLLHRRRPYFGPRQFYLDQPHGQDRRV